MPFAAGAGALAALALWLTWRRPAPDAPQKVNCARGELNAIVLSNPSNSQTVSTQLFLGDKLPVNLPDHWRANLQLPDDGRVDMDLRVQDYAVLRLGGNYSVDEEQRLFPRVFWGRHMTLALTGLAALGALWAVAPNPGDLALTRAWVQSDGPRSYASAEALAQDPPGFGQPCRCAARPVASWCRAQASRRRAPIATGCAGAARRRRCRSWKLIRPSWRCIPANS